jgi:hypothetical protein
MTSDAEDQKLIRLNLVFIFISGLMMFACVRVCGGGFNLAGGAART